MSRVGKHPIQIPDKVEVQISTTPAGGQTVKIKGPKGELQSSFRNEIVITKENNQLIVTRKDDEKLTKSLHGTTRAMIQNMMIGVTDGFKKQLTIIGVGYRAQLQGNKLVLQIGYSHQVEVVPPEGIKLEIDKTQTNITITGNNKQTVGDLAAYIRAVRKPEPYKGKGIKYSDEVIRRKAGKSAAKKA